MTGFADCTGSLDGFSWTWEARSVNGRGLDLRLRLPEGFEALDPVIRRQAAAVLERGSVTIGLSLSHGAVAGVPRLSLPVLNAVIAAAKAAGDAASAAGLDLAPATVADLLSIRGVLETDANTRADLTEVVARAACDIDALLAALVAARRNEGAALTEAIAARLDRIEALVAQARITAEARAVTGGALMRNRLEAVLAAAGHAVDPGRLAQELALVAVRADVTEELDRIGAHVAAARALLAAGEAAGRRLSFLSQEFNREANTLCAKAGSTDLTAIGLDLKVVIDQMREQIQNVE